MIAGTAIGSAFYATGTWCYSQPLNIFIISAQLTNARTKQDLSKVIIVLSLVAHGSIWEV